MNSTVSFAACSISCLLWLSFSFWETRSLSLSLCVLHSVGDFFLSSRLMSSSVRFLLLMSLCLSVSLCLCLSVCLCLCLSVSLLLFVLVDLFLILFLPSLNKASLSLCLLTSRFDDYCLFLLHPKPAPPPQTLPALKC